MSHTNWLIADSGQMSTYINILRHFMLFYACNRDDDKKNPYISFLGYSGRLVPKTEKRGDASPVTEKKGKFRNANIWQRSQKKGKDHLFPKKSNNLCLKGWYPKNEQVKNISE